MGMRRFTQIGKKIIGVGSNYHGHIKEMGGTVPTEPIFFLKPTSSYVIEPNPIRLPEDHIVHHERTIRTQPIPFIRYLVELGVVIGKPGANIKYGDAPCHVAGYAVALDLTARDIQNEAKKLGRPWSIAKGYDTFCPVSAYIPAAAITDPMQQKIWLKVNGEMRQQTCTSDMIFDVFDLVSRISQVMRLEPGDFILTGTPAGVGELKVGDSVMAGLGHDYITMRYKCVPKPKVLNN